MWLVMLVIMIKDVEHDKHAQLVMEWIEYLRISVTGYEKRGL